MYPKVVVIGQSFKGVKRCVVPKQSLSLREIVKRFVRRESLPLSKVGVYEERFGDLEKISKSDIIEQMDYANDLKVKISDFNKRSKEAAARRAKVKSDMDAAALASANQVGVTPVKSPPAGA